MVCVADMGNLSASFTAAQFITAMMWGRVADSSLFGRKTVLMIGLGGTRECCVPRELVMTELMADDMTSAVLHRICLFHLVLAGSGV